MWVTWPWEMQSCHAWTLPVRCLPISGCLLGLMSAAVKFSLHSTPGKSILRASIGLYSWKTGNNQAYHQYLLTTPPPSPPYAQCLKDSLATCEWVLTNLLPILLFSLKKKCPACKDSSCVFNWPPSLLRIGKRWNNYLFKEPFIWGLKNIPTSPGVIAILWISDFLTCATWSFWV